MPVGDVQASSGVDGDAGGEIERGGGGCTAVSGVKFFSVPGDGGDGRSGDPADALVEGVGDVEVVGCIERDGGGQGERGGGGWSVVAGEAWGAGPGYGGDDSVADYTDALVVRVRDVQAAGGVNRDAGRRVEEGRGGGSAVTPELAIPVPATVTIVPDLRISRTT